MNFYSSRLLFVALLLLLDLASLSASAQSAKSSKPAAQDVDTLKFVVIVTQENHESGW